MKKEGMILIIALILCSLIANVNAELIGDELEFTTILGYHNSFDLSCTTNSECVIKNVENCCGYFPMCVPEGTELTPEVVDALCQDYNNTCGSKFLIGKCTCQGEDDDDKKCVGHVARPVIECGDGNCFENESIKDNSQYCAKDCEPNFACAKEGESGECCEGLTSVENKEVSEDGNCEETDGLICLNCGDGECSGSENFCNCPDDCEAEEEEEVNPINESEVVNVQDVEQNISNSDENAIDEDRGSSGLLIILAIIILIIVLIVGFYITVFIVLKKRRKK